MRALIFICSSKCVQILQCYVNVTVCFSTGGVFTLPFMANTSQKIENKAFLLCCSDTPSIGMQENQIVGQPNMGIGNHVIPPYSGHT